MPLDEAGVKALIQPIIDLYKQADGKLNQPKYKDLIQYLPDFFPCYKDLVSQADSIKIHAEKGGFPDKLFFDRAPNQTHDEFHYMKGNFKQNTAPVFLDYLSSNTRCFNDGNWNIIYKEEKNKIYEKLNATFRDYVEGRINAIGSLEEFVKSVHPTLKATDANGVIAVKPKEIYLNDNEEGKTVIDSTKLLEPQPYYYPIKNCLSDPKFDEDYIIVESFEKSTVNYRREREKVGHVFEIYDKTNIWRIEQYGKFSDYTFNINIYFAHNWDRVPATRLIGIPCIKGESLIWQSPFLFACDLLDLALMNENYLQASLANILFPYRVMLGSKCRHEYRCADGTRSTCLDGYVFDTSISKDIKCPECLGSGLKNRVSPLGQMLLAPEDMMSSGDSKFSGKPYEIIDPSTSSSEFVVKKIDRDLLKAYDVLKIRPASQAKGTGISKTGTATEAIFDVKAEMQAAKLFSDQIFSRYEFLLDAIGWQRYAKDYVKPILTYPATCDFYTESDYINLITQLQNAKVAPAVLETIFRKYLRSLYYNEKVTANIFNLIIGTDRLFVLNQQDVILKSKLGLAENWELILHDSATQFIDELIEEHKDAEMCSVDDCSTGFFALGFVDQKQYLIDKAKAKADDILSPSNTYQSPEDVSTIRLNAAGA